MKKHAPGPWLEFGGRVESPNGETVCVMPVWKPELLNAPNTRLITAAPELLEALIDVIGWVPSSEAWHTDTPTKSLARARAAIAKATGETP